MDDTPFRIVDGRTLGRDQRRRMAEVAYAGFSPHAPITPAIARREVREALTKAIACLAAVDAAGKVLGWLAAHSLYDGHTWELHLLVVAPERQGQGIGSALVRALQARAAEHGADWLILWCDDEDNRTNLGGVDLYPRRPGTPRQPAQYQPPPGCVLP
ncbi:MAG: GNAT family N-acetyltransferase [Anaerolineae bacterium]